MKKNLTLKLDEAILKRCKHAAVEEDKSLSAWVSDVIAQAVLSREAMEGARRNALRLLKSGFSLGGKPLTRDQAHER